MPKKSVSIDHPLWKQLRKIDKEAARRFPADCFGGFSDLGLGVYSRPKREGYCCTPTNTLAFAGTGGNGVHFSFLVQNGKVTENSPIVITIPFNIDQPNFIGGESLFDFLCLGYHRGYFALESLPSEKCFEAYASGEWEPKEEFDWYVGLGVNENQRRVLDFLIEQLGLSPWKNLKKRFDRLQKRYLPLLEIPPEWTRLCEGR